MTAKEKARELFDFYKNYVHGYVGSSMLTNYEYPEQILSQTKKAASRAIDELIKEASDKSITVRYKGCLLTDKEFWIDVKIELESIEQI